MGRDGQPAGDERVPVNGRTTSLPHTKVHLDTSLPLKLIPANSFAGNHRKPAGIHRNLARINRNLAVMDGHTHTKKNNNKGTLKGTSHDFPRYVLWPILTVGNTWIRNAC